MQFYLSIESNTEFIYSSIGRPHDIQCQRSKAIASSLAQVLFLTFSLHISFVSFYYIDRYYFVAGQRKLFIHWQIPTLEWQMRKVSRQMTTFRNLRQLGGISACFSTMMESLALLKTMWLLIMVKGNYEWSYDWLIVQLD